MSSVSSSGSRSTAIDRILKIISIIPETTPPTTDYTDGQIIIQSDTLAYASFSRGTDGVMQYLIRDYMGEFVIELIALYDFALTEDNF